MRPFRWAFVIASLLFGLGWLVDHEHDLSSWADSSPSRSVDVLAWLVQAFANGPLAVVVLFARVRDDDVLENANRRRIHSYVMNNRGASLSEIAAGVGLGWGTTVHHIQRMESARLLRSYSDGRRKAFVVEGPSSNLAATYVRTDPARARLLAALVASPGATQGELAARSGLSLPLANRHLRVLERVGLVTSTKTWRTRTYQFPSGSTSPISPMEKTAPHTLSTVSPRGTSIE